MEEWVPVAQIGWRMIVGLVVMMMIKKKKQRYQPV
jgi:hypothetical protein